VIPAHGAAATIARTLRAIANESAQCRLDVPIVVASPADETAEIARRLGARAIKTAERLSAGLARNLGRRHAGDRDLVLFVDADCAPQPGALGVLRDTLYQRSLDAVGASVLADSKSVTAWVRHALEFKDSEPGVEATWPGFVPSATFLCRTRAFDAVGGFPDLWPGEDLVLCSRLLRAGFRVRRVDAAVTLHRHPVGIANLLRHQYELGTTSARARCMTSLDGEFFARHGATVPLLFAGRSMRMVRWLYRHRRSELARGLLATPLYAAGLSAWCAGFMVEGEGR
jgi:glycosyltransferase involved in cell wall biosynthesis